MAEPNPHAQTTTTTTTTATQHTLPPPFSNTSSSQTPIKLITQGAEALLYQTTFLTPTQKCALKYRPKKSYRHPTLDVRLTKARILAEARALVKCRREGVRVPAVLGADWENGWLAMEWIEGDTVRNCLRAYLKGVEGVDLNGDVGLRGLMGRIGVALGRLHAVGVCHGDLTTSNLMIRKSVGSEMVGEGVMGLRIEEMAALEVSMEEDDVLRARESARLRCLDGDIVIIDFGLAMQVVQDEDRAVDLYVLERAFGSTHPQAEGLFEEVLRVYSESYKGAKTVLKRLEDVRLRGRKKSMLG